MSACALHCRTISIKQSTKEITATHVKTQPPTLSEMGNVYYVICNYPALTGPSLHSNPLREVIVVHAVAIPEC